MLAPHNGKARLIEIKEEVLCASLRFVHVEVWVDFLRVLSIITTALFKNILANQRTDW